MFTTAILLCCCISVSFSFYNGKKDFKQRNDLRFLNKERFAEGRPHDYKKDFKQRNDLRFLNKGRFAASLVRDKPLYEEKNAIPLRRHQDEINYPAKDYFYEKRGAPRKLFERRGRQYEDNRYRDNSVYDFKTVNEQEELNLRPSDTPEKKEATRDEKRKQLQEKDLKYRNFKKELPTIIEKKGVPIKYVINNFKRRDYSAHHGDYPSHGEGSRRRGDGSTHRGDNPRQQFAQRKDLPNNMRFQDAPVRQEAVGVPLERLLKADDKYEELPRQNYREQNREEIQAALKRDGKYDRYYDSQADFIKRNLPVHREAVGIPLERVVKADEKYEELPRQNYREQNKNFAKEVPPPPPKGIEAVLKRDGTYDRYQDRQADFIKRNLPVHREAVGIPLETARREDSSLQNINSKKISKKELLLDVPVNVEKVGQPLEHAIHSKKRDETLNNYDNLFNDEKSDDIIPNAERQVINKLEEVSGHEDTAKKSEVQELHDDSDRSNSAVKDEKKSDFQAPVVQETIFSDQADSIKLDASKNVIEQPMQNDQGASKTMLEQANYNDQNEKTSRKNTEQQFKDEQKRRLSDFKLKHGEKHQLHFETKREFLQRKRDEFQRRLDEFDRKSRT